MSVGLDWEAKSAGKTEICKFNDRSGGVDEKVLRLQISVEDAVLMQVNEGLEDLVEEALCLLLGERLIPVLSHVLFEVELQVLEDEIELLLGIDDLLQFDHVWMFKSF